MLTKLTIPFPGPAEINEKKLGTMLWNQDAANIPQSVVGVTNLYWSKEAREKYKKIQETQDKITKLAYNYAIAAFTLENYPNFIDYTDDLLYNPGTRLKMLPLVERDMEFSGISKAIKDMIYEKPFMYLNRFGEMYKKDMEEKKANNKPIQQKTLMKAFMVSYTMDHDYMFRKFLNKKKTIFETRSMDILMSLKMKTDLLNERAKANNINCNTSTETAIVGWIILQIEKEMLEKYSRQIESKYTKPWNFKSDLKEKEKQEQLEKEKKEKEERKRLEEERKAQEPIPIGNDEIRNNIQAMGEALEKLREGNTDIIDNTPDTPENNNNEKIIFINPEGIYDVDIPNFTTFAMKLLKSTASMEIKVKDLMEQFNRNNQPFKRMVIKEEDKEIYKEFIENVINGHIGSRDLIKLLADVRKGTIHHA